MSSLSCVPQGSRIDSLDTLVGRFSSQYATSQSHHMTSAALASLCQAEDEPLRKFMDIFGWLVVQIRDLNSKVALHFMLLALRSGKFVDNLCKKPHSSMDKF